MFANVWIGWKILENTKNIYEMAQNPPNNALLMVKVGKRLWYIKVKQKHREQKISKSIRMDDVMHTRKFSFIEKSFAVWNLKKFSLYKKIKYLKSLKPQL